MTSNARRRFRWATATLGFAALSGTALANTPIPFQAEGSDGAPAIFRGLWPISISAVTTVTVPTDGVYHLSGSLTLWRVWGYAAEPTVDSVTLSVAGQTVVSDGGFLVDQGQEPSGWTYFGSHGFTRLNFVKTLDQGVYLPAGAHQVQLRVAGSVPRVNEFHGASLAAHVVGTLTPVAPSVQITGPDVVCLDMPRTMQAQGTPPGGVAIGWRAAPSSVATILPTGLLSGVSPGTVTVEVDYSYPGWSESVCRNRVLTLVRPTPMPHEHRASTTLVEIKVLTA